MPIPHTPDVSRTPAPASIPVQSGLISAEWIYDRAPFPQCHAATLAETEQAGKSVLVAAWFGGTHENHPDVGIWVARLENGRWSQPVEIADGMSDAAARYPCWNPVLFAPKPGALWLFYKVGPTPRDWWGMRVMSVDGGLTWSRPERLPSGILGPIKNKPIALANGDILCPSSTEDRQNGWRVHFERISADGTTWETIGPINDGRHLGIIQPSLLTYPDGRLQALCRSQQKAIVETWSSDGGNTWSSPQATALPNPNSGTDAVTLADGRQLLVYNHALEARSPLNVAVSQDGKTWQAALTLEDQPGEYSYPAVIQTADARVHIAYTWQRRRIKHVVLDPKTLILRDIPNGSMNNGC